MTGRLLAQRPLLASCRLSQAEIMAPCGTLSPYANAASRCYTPLFSL